MVEEKNRSILIDSREPEDLVFRVQQIGVPIDVVTLDAGDYVVGNVLIERKTIDDFYVSLRSGRLFEQLYKMKTSGQKGILCIIGDVPYQYKTMKDHNFASIVRTISSIKMVSYLSYDIVTEQVRTVQEFVDLIADVWKRCNVKSYAPVIKKKENIESIRADMLSRVPGIGSKLADSLSDLPLDTCLHMTEEQWKEWKISDKRRVGTKTGHDIFETLRRLGLK